MNELTPDTLTIFSFKCELEILHLTKKMDVGQDSAKGHINRLF